jgi:glucose-6-phosphate dehydrogenase assembly protein OpcA
MWREMIAYTLELVAKTFTPIQSVTVEHYGSAPSTSGLYLGAWLARALPNAKLAFREAAGERGHVAGVVLRAGGEELAFRRLEGDTVQITGPQSNVVVLPHASDYRTMREELSITRLDPTFEAVYRRARELLRA